MRKRKENKQMKDGFVKVAAATPKVKVAAVAYNTQQTLAMIQKAAQNGAKLIVFPELGLTAYTCGDLFNQGALIEQAKQGLLALCRKTANLDILSVVGLPLSVDGKLYNVAAFIKEGKILGFVPKSNLPNYGEFYEQRHFNTTSRMLDVIWDGKEIPMGTDLIFCAKEEDRLRIACEICEDLWISAPPSGRHAQNGATVMVNLSASDESIAKSSLRRDLVKIQSAKCIAAYLYANAGAGESTTDIVFAGHNMIYEIGEPLAESELFSEGIIYADIDLDRIILERRRQSTFQTAEDPRYRRIYFSTKKEETHLTRYFTPHPFVPHNAHDLHERCEETFLIQVHGLKKRLSHIGTPTVTLGISGGLDSTLALLVTAKAFDLLNLPRNGIIAVTMPCFGTTSRTYQNAVNMIKSIGASFREINIKEAVTQHLHDIGASLDDHDTTFENAQARERTQVLMDIANKTGGIVIGTGDLSELAMGFATYNGDHMSMYGVNASVPKTLVRFLVQYVADQSDAKLKATLYDVLDTPVSPELLPPEENGNIAQQTENIIGPYELHDFFLYHMVRHGFSKDKIARMAAHAFSGDYTPETIQKWLDIFMRRFFNNQFKRSCLPDGPKVGSVSLSPRGDWRMPSDSVNIYTESDEGLL